MNFPNSTRQIKFAEIGSSSIFIFLAILLSISRIPFPDSVLPIYLVGASALIVVSLFWIRGGFQTSANSAIALIIFFSILIIWAFATRAFFSPGDDEYGYHILALWDLANGWDPFFTPHDNIWLDSYPSGLYVIESYMVALTGLLLSGQSVIVGLMAAVAFQAYGVFLEHVSSNLPRFKHTGAFLFACILVANPIVLTQIMTHYVDAPLYLFGCALLLFLMSDAISSNGLARWSAISCMILLVNTKTAALYYVPLIVFGGFVMDLVLKHTESGLFDRGFRWVTRKGIIYCAAFAFGIVVIGYKPFVTNFQDHGEFLYPSVNEIMKGNAPENTLPLSPPMKFVYGIASETGESIWPLPFDVPIELKIPGTFRLGEFKYLRFDTRRGGFGPFFSLALIASILAYASARFSSRNKRIYTWHREGDAIAALSLVVFLASMFFPESWWARYVPYIWVCAILFATSSLFLKGSGTGLVLSRIILGVAVISFLGCIFAGLIGAARQHHKTYQKTQIIGHLSKFPLVELYPEIDNRITTDFQSKTITSAGDVWAKLIEARGAKVRVYKNTGNEIFDHRTYCKKEGWLEADVFWCVPRIIRP